MTLQDLMKKAIFSNIVKIQTSTTIYCCLHWIKVSDTLRDTVRSGVKPK